MPTGGAGVTEGSKLPACWVPNSRPLQEQYILLAIESSLAPRDDYFVIDTFWCWEVKPEP